MTSLKRQAPFSNRVVFFDNLRYFFVIGVIFQHSTMAYFGSSWWPVRDQSNVIAGGISSMICGMMDGFLMPSLFFIAGYFAIPSMQKRSIFAFIKGKLQRLGIPWLICILFVCPLLPFVFHLTRNGLELSTSYWESWKTIMEAAIGLDVAVLPSMAEIMQNDLFYQRYMWFVSLLIAFFLIFSLVYGIKKDWLRITESTPSITPSVKSTLILIFAFGVITFLGSMVLIQIMFFFTEGVTDADSWFTLGNIIQFRVGRIFMHASYFIFGILVYKWRWVERGLFPGHLKTLAITFVIAFLGYMPIAGLMQFGPDHLKDIFAIVYRVFLNLYTISALGLTSALVYKYLNQPTRLNRTLATNSYNIYLAHYPLVLGLQFLFFLMPDIPAVLKFFAVGVGATIGAYIIGEFLIRRFPRLTVLGIVGGFIWMILILQI